MFWRTSIVLHAVARVVELQCLRWQAWTAGRRCDMTFGRTGSILDTKMDEVQTLKDFSTTQASGEEQQSIRMRKTLSCMSACDRSTSNNRSLRYILSFVAHRRGHVWIVTYKRALARSTCSFFSRRTSFFRLGQNQQKCGAPMVNSGIKPKLSTGLLAGISRYRLASNSSVGRTTKGPLTPSRYDITMKHRRFSIQSSSSGWKTMYLSTYSNTARCSSSPGAPMLLIIRWTNSRLKSGFAVCNFKRME